jgi:hypothetical protein
MIQNGILNIYFIHIKTPYYQLQMMLRQYDVLLMVKNDYSFFLFYSMLDYLGEPYFEKQKPYPHYQRTPLQRLRRYNKKKSSKKLLSKISYLNFSTNVEDDSAHQYKHKKRRAKRQLDLDPTAKHVEVLVAYDYSIKNFHSDADIKSYILTLFSYVSFSREDKYFNINLLYLGISSIF